jgi:hypothetical protein
MQCDAFMFTACKGAVLGPLASADDPNHWVRVTSFCAGQCQHFAGKPHLPNKSSEEPSPPSPQSVDKLVASLHSPYVIPSGWFVWMQFEPRLIREKNCASLRRLSVQNIFNCFTQ